MRKLFMSALILSSVAAAAPAAAQHRGYDRGHHAGYDRSYGHDGGYGYRQLLQRGDGIARELNQLQNQIDRLRDRRLVSREEARRLSHRAARLDNLLHRYRSDGLSRYEQRELQNRVSDLRREVRAERLEGRYAQRYSRW